jgi:hypothetical protein
MFVYNFLSTLMTKFTRKKSKELKIVMKKVNKEWNLSNYFTLNCQTRKKEVKKKIKKGSVLFLMICRSSGFFARPVASDTSNPRLG